MSLLGRIVLSHGLLLLVAACSFGEDAFGPSQSSRQASGEVPANNQQVQILNLNTGSFEPGGVTPGQPTGTVVGEKVQELRSGLERLQGEVVSENQRLQQARDTSKASASRYHALKASINSRLQVGTTPGNPELVSQWRESQTELRTVDASINEMNDLANTVSATASLSTYLVEATRATFGLSGAIDEDHRQLAILEDEVNQTTVLIDRLLSELTEDIARQTAFLSSERNNLNAMSVAIKNGEYIGVSLANRSFGAPAPQAPGGGAALVGRQQPLVVIRFDSNNVDYEQVLFGAVSRALERRPNAAFDLVALAPGQGQPGQVALNSGQVRRDAERVLRSLANMGLPADRVSLSAVSAPRLGTPEVHVYVR